MIKTLLRKKAFLLAAIMSCTLFSFLGKALATIPDEEILKDIQTLSRSYPIREAEHMYSGTTPMVLVRDETGEARYVLKNRYDPVALEREIDTEEFSLEGHNFRCNKRTYEAVENTLQAFSLTRAAGVGATFADTYHLTGVPLTFITENGESETRSFYGFAQPVVTLFSDRNKDIVTPLTNILRRVDRPHGALSCLALYESHLTEKWVSMEKGEKIDPARKKDYRRYNRTKRVSLDPKITKEEYAFIMASISRASVEDDFLSFMLTQSGDSIYRNWMLSLEEDGATLGIKLIDFEKIFSPALSATAPMALGTIQGFYPLSDMNREKVLFWDGSRLTSVLPDEKVERGQRVIAELQGCLREEPSLSLQNLYFKVFGKLQGGRGNIGKYAHYGWSNSGVPVTLADLARYGVVPQDPAYSGLVPQFPFFEEIAHTFEETASTKHAIDTLEEALTGTNHRRYSRR